jgi:hypothetical protein
MNPENKLEVVEYDTKIDEDVDFIFEKLENGDKNGNAPTYKIMKLVYKKYVGIGRTCEDKMADEGCHFRNALEIFRATRKNTYSSYEITHSDLKDLMFFIEYLNGLNKVVNHREGDLIIPVLEGVWRDDLSYSVVKKKR